MKSKVMTWVSIMALLVSQSYTYASVPCESNWDIRSQHSHAMSSNGLAPKSHHSFEHDMSMHMQQDQQQNTAQNMHQQMQQKTFEMDCCDDECSCNTGTYSSITISHFMNFSSLRLVSDSLGLYLSLTQVGFFTSLHKPPIIS